MFNMRRIGDLYILQSDLLPLGVPHGFTTKRLAGTKPGQALEYPNFRIDSLPETVKWWLRLRDGLFTPAHTCFVNQQTHGGRVRVIDPNNLEGEEKEVDGFRLRVLGEGDAILKPFTRKPIFLAVTAADCLPCLVHDRGSHAVGVVHAGWRGLAADIVGKAVEEFRKSLGSRVTDLLWVVGPSIDVDYYQVGPEVIAALETAGYAESDWRSSAETPGWIKEKKGDRYRLNMAACLKSRLKSLGVPKENIDISVLSTYANANLFYSYRRDGEIKGLIAAVIG